MPTRAHWFGLAAALMLAGVPSHAAETSITAIVGATVIHPDRDLPSAIAPDSTLIIAGRRIESIGPAGSTAVPAGGTRIGWPGQRGGSRGDGLALPLLPAGQLYTRSRVGGIQALSSFSQGNEREKSQA